MITHNNPKSSISEAYRVLRTNIQYSSIDKPLKTIVVTSSGPGEGKSTTIVNLSIAFAQSGSKVLLIDADLRKPKVHKLFGMYNKRGLSNMLVAHYDYQEYINKCEVENLHVLTCGVIPPNPSELLSTKSMKQFIEKIREDYDMVFIDAPPVGTVTDAAILSTEVDGVIMVISSGKVDDKALIRSKELLEKVNANIIGVVLNKVNKNNQGYYHNHYYDYQYGDPQPVKKHYKRRQNKNKKIADKVSDNGASIGGL
jgi:capsular exopolysaccharide synthesis family protein